MSPLARSLAAAVLLTLVPATACTGGKPGGSGDSGDSGGGTLVQGDGGAAVDCGSTVPVITDGPWCTYLGMLAPEPGEPEAPTLRVDVAVHDDDGDLDYRATRLWYDQEPYGEIDVDTARLKERSLSKASDRPCGTFDAPAVGDKVYLRADTTHLGELYDWGVQVSDARGNWSEMAIVTCAAPNPDGTQP